MTMQVKVGEAKTRLSELLVKVEKGEEIIIARGDVPVARLTRINKKSDSEKAIQAIRDIRKTIKPVSLEEILSWKEIGRK